MTDEMIAEAMGALEGLKLRMPEGRVRLQRNDHPV